MRIPGPWRLLAALALVVIVGVAMATWLYARRRMEAIEYVRSHGGYINFADGHDGSPVPDWLRRIQSIGGLPEGSDLRNCATLSEATDLHLEQTGDEDLQPIGRFRQLKRLELIDTRVTGLGLRCLRECPRLEGVEIWTSSNGDELLEAMAGLPLTSVRLRDVPVTDAGLRHFAGMPLEELVLSYTDVTDAGLAEVGRLAALSTLSLQGSKISDVGLKYLSSLPIRSLVLSDTKVTDAGLPELAGMPLAFLSLDRTKVTDAGLHDLKRLPLEHLSLTKTYVMPEGVRVLYGMKGLTMDLSRPPFYEAERDELEAAGIRVHVTNDP